MLNALPLEVKEDFICDSTFRITAEKHVPGKGTTLFMCLPASAGEVSRCVVLRTKLETAPEAFALYIIAHEFAHAYLRNGGWGDISDSEQAADSLAEHWGFQRPRSGWF